MKNSTVKNSTFILSAIAGITLVYYYLNSFEFFAKWWGLLALTVVGGLVSLAFYHLALNYRIANAILATGLSLLLVVTLLPLFEEFDLIEFFPSYELFEFIVMTIAFVAVAFPTEGYVNRAFHPGDLILDPMVAAGISFVITWLNKPLITPGILLLGFIIIIFINLSLKERKEGNDNNEGSEEEEPPIYPEDSN